jgi:hypothetical protein
MATRTMTAVVTECNCFGERNVEPKCACNRRGDLSNFESMREASALMVLWKNKHLCLARKTSKCRGMQDAVAVTLETGAKWVCFYSMRTIASTECTSGEWGKRGIFT